jgi:1-acyl-sn-glycerol-3-phosphate acyltransferase
MSVSGRERIRQTSDPILFVANHVTLGDHALVLAALPFNLRHRLAIAMEGELLRMWLHPPAETGLFTRLRWLSEYFLVNLFFHVFPLPKKSGFRRSFAYAGECIDRGESVLVFPEGRRAPRGQMHLGHFKSGIGVLAQALNVPVVPVKLEGLYELNRRQQYFADPSMVRVILGEPVTFTRDTAPTAIAEDLEQRLSDLS